MLKELITSGKTTFDEVESAMYNMKKRITELEKENAELRQMHFLDQSEKVNLRRMVEVAHDGA
jgi:hypothetical protein